MNVSWTYEIPEEDEEMQKLLKRGKKYFTSGGPLFFINDSWSNSVITGKFQHNFFDIHA